VALLVTGSVASLAANVAVAQPTPVGSLCDLATLVARRRPGVELTLLVPDRAGSMLLHSRVREADSKIR
jgi:hypothetical protein